MANKLPLVMASNGTIQQLQPTDMLTVPGVYCGDGTGEATLLSFTSRGGDGVWLDLPITGPSGVGTGGAGQYAWLGYCFAAGNWCSDSVVGDLAYRNLAGRLLWGTSIDASQMSLSTSGLTIATPTAVTSPITVPNVTSNDNSTNAANTAFVQNAISGINNKLMYAGIVGVTSGTTQIPFGNNAPLITAGTQLWSQSLTPPTTSSSFLISFGGMIDCSSSAQNITVAIFRGSVLIGFITQNITTTNRPDTFSIQVYDAPSVITPVTYSCRIGVGSSSTWYIGRAATATMGGVNNSAWSICEVN